MNAETAEIIAWVTSDRPVRNRLVAILEGGDGYGGRRASAVWGNSPNMAGLTAHVAAMADFLEHLLRWDDGSMYRSLYRQTDGAGSFDSRVPGRVRDALGPDVWYEIEWGVVKRQDAADWNAVRDSVMR